MSGAERFPCTVTGCDYVGGTAKARALHVQNKHPLELKPLPAPPNYQPLPNARRAVIYLRVSTIDQHPENQLPAARAFCGMRGFELARECGKNGLYEDKGVSGKNLDRPALKDLIRDAGEGRFEVVVFRRLSRLGRSLRDNIALWDYFQSVGVALVSVEEPYDTTTPAGRLIRNVMASVAEYQREEMLEQQREGIERRRAEGKPIGRHPNGCGIPKELGGRGPCPYGVNHLPPPDFNDPEKQALRAYKARKQREYRERKKHRDQQRAGIRAAPFNKAGPTQGGLSGGNAAPANGG
jgi:DNA invertase Pin-like site-specific DNA recombinase